MNKLINIKIEGNELSFTVDAAVDIRTYNMEVYIDEVCNLDNILCDNPVHNFGIYENIVVYNQKNITVTDDIILGLDQNMKYITLRCYTEANEIRLTGIYYNSQVIYNAEIRKLHNYCSACLDDKNMQNLMLVVFKRQLLDYALEADQFKDAMVIYNELCRLLDISTCSGIDNDVCCDNAILTQKGNCFSANQDKCLHLERDYKQLAVSKLTGTCSYCDNGYCTI